MIPAEQIPLALEYIDAIIDKIIRFWYDSNKHSINLWWDGRQTNNYRGVERALEVNLDVCNHLKQILHNLSCVGLDELDISKTIPSPKKVEYKELLFDKTKQNQDECILFRIKDQLIMLPFVGAGSLGTLTSYMPFPALQGTTEVPPSTSLPFYVPEFIGEDETHYRVGQYYSNIQTERVSNGIRCKTNGNLFVYKNGFPQKSDFQFEITCFIQLEQIEITYETNLKYKNALLYIGLLNTPIDVIGDFQIQKEILEPQEYFTPSGSYNRIEQYSFCHGPIHYLIHLA